MTRREVLDELATIMELPKGSLSGDEVLESLGEWDSVAILEFLAFADEKAGVSISPKSIARCKTLSEVAALVETPQAESRAVD